MPASESLRAMERALSVLPSDTPLTAGVLLEKVQEALTDVEESEYGERMGDDL